MRPEENSVNVDADGAPVTLRTLLEGRRKFLVGSVGLTAFAATLRSRPAFAGEGNWCSWAQQQACSPNPSHAIPKTFPTSYHCDYFVSKTANWGSWSGSWKTVTFGTCGWSPPAGCGLTAGQTLISCLSPCYSQQGTGHPWSFQTGANADNLGCWLACAFLCAETDSGNLGYTCPELATACTQVLTTPSCNITTCATWLCTAISTICTKGCLSPSPGFKGGTGTCLKY